ncbi:MAG: hypothetical protein COA88_06910 [Kordia sp.]|nr:MAG: hypothetical protein COA88_06910 [Kordia sp.]
MKKNILLFVLFISVTAFAQKELNAYKYIVIPSRFDFQKEANQYGINLLLKYKFQQLGFEVFLDTDDLPQELRTNTCFYASPVLLTKSNMFKTRVSVELLDCYNKSLFKTQEGISTSKNFKMSYNEAVRMALKSFGDYKLKYAPVKEEVVLNEDSQLIKQEVVKQNVYVSSLENKLNSGSFSYKGEEFLLVKKGGILFEIQNKKTNVVVGKMIASGFKKGISHVEFNGKVGFGYYGENGSLIMEFMSSEDSVEMISLPKIN